MLHLNIPLTAFLPKSRIIPKKRFYPVNSPENNAVEYIEWYATVNKVSGIQSVIDQTHQYEEIQFLRINLAEDADMANTNLFAILQPVLKQITYQCLVTLSYRSKCKLVSCQCAPGKIHWEDNILSPIRMTAWMYPGCPSEKAQLCLDTINNALQTQQDIRSMYNQIHTAIGVFKPVTITKEHVRILLKDMLGKIPISTWTGKPTDILRDCTPYKYHPIIGPNVFVGKRSDSYLVLHDTEDIWHCFLLDPRLARIIAGRRYTSPEEMFYRIRERCEANRF